MLHISASQSLLRRPREVFSNVEPGCRLAAYPWFSRLRSSGFLKPALMVNAIIYARKSAAEASLPYTVITQLDIDVNKINSLSGGSADSKSVAGDSVLVQVRPGAPKAVRNILAADGNLHGLFSRSVGCSRDLETTACACLVRQVGQVSNRTRP